MATKTTTPSVEDMRKLVAEADRKASEEGLDQLNALVGSDEWLKVKSDIATARELYGHDPLAKLQLDGMATVMKGVESLPAQVRQRIAAAQ